METEEALTVLFCLLEDAYAHLNPRAQRYESIKRLSDSEVIALPLFQQLRGVESERSFLRDAQRFFSHLFPGVVGLHPSSLHRRVRKLRRFLEPLRRAVLYEMVGEPETLLVDSTFLSVLHPRQVSQGSGFSGAAWVRWGSFSVYGVKLDLVCATNGVPLSYELTPANVADVSLAEELLAEAALGHAVARRLLGDLAYRSEGLKEALAEELIDEAALGDGVARRLFGDLAYRSEGLKEALAEVDILLVTEPSERRHGLRQRVEIAISSLKRVLGLGKTLASTLVGLATRITAKIAAYTYALAVNRMLGRPQGHIKELWA